MGLILVRIWEALENKGNNFTRKIIGTGLDVYYPKENKALQDYMTKNHLVLTEYGPSESRSSTTFLNAIGLFLISQGVMVVEAKLRSGSLIVCERAMEEGRDVFAIPGNILDEIGWMPSPNSGGCKVHYGQGLSILSEFS